MYVWTARCIRFLYVFVYRRRTGLGKNAYTYSNTISNNHNKNSNNKYAYNKYEMSFVVFMMWLSTKYKVMSRFIHHTEKEKTWKNTASCGLSLSTSGRSSGGNGCLPWWDTSSLPVRRQIETAKKSASHPFEIDQQYTNGIRVG